MLKFNAYAIAQKHGTLHDLAFCYKLQAFWIVYYKFSKLLGHMDSMLPWQHMLYLELNFV